MRRLILVIAVGIGTLVFGASTASAHENNSSATCAGINASASGYELVDTNTLTVFIDGAQVFTADFGTGFNQTFPVPQDGAVHSWTVVIDSSDDQWDVTNSGQVGPCGTGSTTTTSTTTSTTTVPGTTTSTTTTVPGTTTSTTTTDPGTTTSMTTSPVDPPMTPPAGKLPQTR